MATPTMVKYVHIKTLIIPSSERLLILVFPLRSERYLHYPPNHRRRCRPSGHRATMLGPNTFIDTGSLLLRVGGLRSISDALSCRRE